MTTKTKKLAAEIIALPIDDRTILLDRLVASIHEDADPEVEKAWMEEAERRWKEIESGKVKCVPHSEVMRKARAALKRCA